MIFRNILHKINPFLETKQVIAINGMRRTGKTTLIKYLLNNCPGTNKAFFDLERAENRYLFSDNNYKCIWLEKIFPRTDLMIFFGEEIYIKTTPVKV